MKSVFYNLFGLVALVAIASLFILFRYVAFTIMAIAVGVALVFMLTLVLISPFVKGAVKIRDWLT